ncbi:RipA family octameric membrane protein [Lutibacter oceani]|uniref:RipA family octameric membrane protein n=1 Tax=Lutibacter oceani TaxID=1853311 RepID=UPI0011C034C6|nr:hypothetical protein [Lutibacter oceani]
MKNELSKTYERIKKDYKIDLYDKVLELRKFEIENFWKRTLFFWGTIALVYAGYFKADLKEYQLIIPLIGLLFNIIFSLSTRGSKYWQEHWETIAVLYENELGFDLFKNNTQNLVNKNSKSKLTKPYRFSVSKLTMLLGDLSVLLWTILWIKEIINLFETNKLKFDFCSENSSINWFTVGVISIHLVLVGYFIIFLKNGDVYHKFEKEETENETTEK